MTIQEIIKKQITTNKNFLIIGPGILFWRQGQEGLKTVFEMEN